MLTIDFIEVKTVQAMGVGELAVMSLGNVTSDIDARPNSDTANNMLVSSTSNCSVKFPANFTSFIPQNIGMIGLCLTTIPQKSINQFTINPNSTRAAIVGLTIANKQTLESLRPTFGNVYALISIPCRRYP